MRDIPGIVAFYAAGHSTIETAAKFGISKRWAMVLLYRAGIKLREPKHARRLAYEKHRIVPGKPNHRRCCACKRVKHVSKFGKRSHGVDGLDCRCKACRHEKDLLHYIRFAESRRACKKRDYEKRREHICAKSRRYHHANRDQIFERWHLKKHGITLAERKAMFAAQGNCCAICGADTPQDAKGRWCMDHDHVTGELRGILCSPCNRTLGFMRDDPKRLEAAAAYLRQPPARAFLKSLMDPVRSRIPST